MRKKKLAKTAKQHANEWMAMTPRDHLDQAADIFGTVLGNPHDAVLHGGQLAHAQTHLLAGLLKTQLSGGVGIPTD